MTFKISLKQTGVDKLTRDLTQVQKRIVPAVTLQSINRATRRMNTESVREISKRTGIKQKLVRKRVKVKLANRRSLRSRIVGLVLPTRSGDLGIARDTRSGAKVGRFNFPGAFAAVMPTGRNAAFKRKGSSRLPITEQSVPLEPTATQALTRHFNTTAPREFVKEFTRQLKRRLRSR